jgi:tetratricopeptide (TPR) repeat protein
MKYLILITITLFSIKGVKAQYGDAYHAPDNYALQRAADKRASDQLNTHYNNIAPNNSNSSGSRVTGVSTTSQNSWGDGGAFQRRQAAYEEKVKNREDAFNAKMNKFLSLSANIAKNEDNYDKLNQMAVDAGFDYYSATRINGLYAPKNDAASIEKRNVKEFDRLVSVADEKLARNWIPEAIYSYRLAVMSKNNPFIRKKIGDLLCFIGEYHEAYNAYKEIEESGITPRPSKDENDYNVGKAVLMNCDYKEAIVYLEKSWAGNKNYLNGIALSYTYFLENNYAAAALIIKEPIIEEESFMDANLIEQFFVLQKGDDTKVKKIIETIKKDLTEIKISGDTKKDFASILHYQAKKNVSKDREVKTVSFYLLDMAIKLDNDNLDFIETRFAFNTERKRFKLASADEAILNK